MPPPPYTLVVPLSPTNGSEDIPTPLVVVTFDPPETFTSGLTRIVIVVMVVEPTISVTVIVSRYEFLAAVIADT